MSSLLCAHVQPPLVSCVRMNVLLIISGKVTLRPPYFSASSPLVFCFVVLHNLLFPSYCRFFDVRVIMFFRLGQYKVFILVLSDVAHMWILSGLFYRPSDKRPLLGGLS